MAVFNPQASTAAMNAAGFLDNPAGRELFAQQQQAGGTVSVQGAQTQPANPNGPQLTNVDQNQLLANAAEKAAYQAYLNAKLALDTDQEAFTKAQAAFTNEITKAGLTGTYNGTPTQAAVQNIAQTYGYYDPGMGIQAGTPTQAAIKQSADLSGMYNGAPTEAAREANNSTALGYLNLISKLNGPADFGSYLRTIGSTPGGIRDLVSSAAGQYVPSSGSTTGMAPTPQTLGSLVGAAATGQSGGTTYADYQAAAAGLPAPNQLSPAAMNAYTTSQKQALMGMYGQQGYIPQDVQDLYAQSLPKYTFNAGTTGTVKM